MTTLREQLDAEGLVVAPGVIDALGARLVQHLGFGAVYLGGWSTGAHLAVGEPLLTMTEQFECARRISRAVEIPLIVDGNAGFGDPLHTVRAVREAELAGISALHIEDQEHPKKAHYHVGIEDVCERHEFLDKIRLALRARGSDDFLVIARTDAAKARNADTEEAIWRCRAALDIGADLVMPLVTPAVPTVEGLGLQAELDRIRAALPDDARVVLLSGYLPGQEEMSIQQYKDRGFSMILFPVVPSIAEVAVLKGLYEPLARDGVLPGPGAQIGFGVDEYPDLQRLTEELIGFAEQVQLERETVEAGREHTP